MRQLISSLTCSGFFLLAACAGEAPSNNGPDAPPEVDAGVDAPPGDPGQRLTGKTMDYFSAATPMADAMITSDGVAPVMMATSLTGGDFAIDGVPTGSKVYFSVARSPLYRPTRNPPVTIEGAAVVQNLYLATIADINRQYTTVGLPPPAAAGGKAVIFAQLKMNNGMPLGGVPVTNVTLVDALGQPVPGIAGPFVFGALDVLPAPLPPAVADLTIVDGRSRIAYLDVPPGAHTLKVTYLDGLVSTTMSVPVTTVADGATLAVTGGTGTPLPPAITNPTFAAHIYPKLQKAALGGLGCANCHTAGGTAAGIIQYDLGATITLENMKARLGLIDLVAPALSLLLTKPLYEPAPYNHPNATFIDINDPDYKLFLLWITQGALP